MLRTHRAIGNEFERSLRSAATKVVRVRPFAGGKVISEVWTEQIVPLVLLRQYSYRVRE
jgi:hypothetical protein